jgi:hypothetical protein|tara:strand:+ start:662 stop:796 length:135 start_codon:yes stop_codon:yes gene_type:complete
LNKESLLSAFILCIDVEIGKVMELCSGVFCSLGREEEKRKEMIL